MARYALVIGIAQYQSSNLKPLPKAATDAEVVARVLEEYGEYTVTRLPHRWNAEPQRFEVAQQKSVSADEVCEALQTLLLEQGTKSDVLIYFAGHGLTFFDNLGEQKGALATSDCQVEMVGRQVVNYRHGIDLSSLNRLIKKSDLSSLVMLLDCCHSGYFLESQLVQQTLTAFSTQRDYYLIAACRSGETVKALAGEAHAIFTGALLKGLASENASRNGQVSGDRLFDYISNELKGTQWGQEPIRMGWGRSITLVTYRPSETPSSETTFERKNPYLGLSAFEAEQEKYFYGREEAVRMLITHLTNSRFLSILGYSGSGKSSLIKAGLLPQLSRDRIPGSSQWSVESFTPGKHPRGKLVDILARDREQNQPFVIFIDQFEEVFTLCEDEAERQGFIRLIAEEMNDSERKSRMIIALRGDFLSRCANYPDVLNLINHIPTTTYIVKSLGIEELPEAIEKPAELHGVKFERGLVSHIAQDVAGQPGALPLLQYALKELWRVCIEKPASPEPLLTKKGYEEIGGVQGALENRANVIYQSLSDGDRIFVRKLFMELVQLGEGKEVTRRRVDWERLRAIADSPEQLERVIGLLAGSQQRLIIVDKNSVEVVHEALLCRWKLLSGWIEEDLENIRISRRLEVACREWEKTYRKSDDALLTGARLAEVEEWEKRVQPHLTGDEREFLRKSVGRRDREVQAELQQQRQLREAAEAKAMAELEKSIEAEARVKAEAEKAEEAIARAKAEAEKAQEATARAKAESQKTKLALRGGVLLAMLAILTSGLAVWAKAESNRATTNEIKSLTESATTFFSVNYQLESLTASVKALRLIGKKQGEVPTAIKKIIEEVREHNRLDGHTKEIKDVSFSPEGNIIASGSDDQTVRIWKKEGKLLAELKHTTGVGVWGVSFSPNSPNLATADTDGIIKVWDIKKILNKSHAEIKLPERDSLGTVIRVNFSRDGKFIASVHWDKSVRIWELKTKKLIKTIIDKQHPSDSFWVSFSPDGKKLATARRDKTVKIWSLDNNTSPKILRGHRQLVYAVSFSPNGEMIASSSWDKSIKLWQVDNGKLIRTFEGLDGHSDEVNGIAFSHDGKMIASASRDKTIKLWRVADGKLMQTFKGHTNTVNSVSFSPDDQTIASASDDKTVRIWSLNKISLPKNDVNEAFKNSCNWLENYLINNINIVEVERQICN